MDKCHLLTQVYDHILNATVSFEEEYIGADFAYFVGAVLKDGTCEWGADRPFVGLLQGLPKRERDAALRYITQTDPTPTWEAAASRARGLVTQGDRALVAFRDDGPVITLALGDALGTATRVGAILTRLLGIVGNGPFWVVAVRPGGAPLKREREAAERIQAAARLVDLPVYGVGLCTTKSDYLLTESDK